MKTVATPAPKSNARGAQAAVPADLAGAVARLRAAAALQDPDPRREGREAGEAWAKDRAMPRQLARLACYVRRAGSMDAMQLVAVIHNESPDEAGDDMAAREFFEELFGLRDEAAWDEPGFVAAFTAAALRTWNRVRPLI